MNRMRLPQAWRSLLALTLLAGCAASAGQERAQHTVTVTPVASQGSSAQHCARRAEAAEVASEADRAASVDIDAAIASYERAVKLDPDHHGLRWKLALAYETKEDWARVVTALEAAVELAPAYASYWSKLGQARLRQGAIKPAGAAFQRCLEIDENYRECHGSLGIVLEAAGREQDALRSYTRAIQAEPTDPSWYRPLGSLYFALKLMREARAVLEEGARRIPSIPSHDAELYQLHVLLASVAQAERDPAGSLAALEKAHEYAGAAHPEVFFLTGREHARAEPPAKEAAVSLLMQFIKRACRGAAAVKFKEQCEEASSILQRLGR